MTRAGTNSPIRRVIALDGETLTPERIRRTIGNVDRSVGVRKDFDEFMLVAGTPSNVEHALGQVDQACYGGDQDEVRTAIGTFSASVNQIIEAAGIHHVHGERSDIWLDKRQRALTWIASHMAMSSYESIRADRLYTVGQKVGSALVAALLNQRGVGAMPVDSMAALAVKATYGRLEPDLARTASLMAENGVLGLYDRKIAAVIGGGFARADGNGGVANLGPRGTDYSAAMLAACGTDKTVLLLRSDLGGLGNYNAMSYKEAGKFSSAHHSRLLHPAALDLAEASKLHLYVHTMDSPYAGGVKIWAPPSGA